MKILNTPSLYLLILFGALWLPYGQYLFLIEHWMKVGVFVAPVLLFMFTLLPRTGSSSVDVQAWSVWMLVIYIAHQFEEHWIDLFGNRYAFYLSVNDLVSQALGRQGTAVEVLTPVSIFVINTSLVWLVGFLAILRSNRSSLPALAMNGIILINAIVHILSALLQRQYNPGLFTSVVLFIPFSLWAYRAFIRTGTAKSKQVTIGLVWALLAHVLMVGGMFASNVAQIISEVTYHILLIAWSLLPFLLSFTPQQSFEGRSNNSPQVLKSS